jgi:hypothetical protein
MSCLFGLHHLKLLQRKGRNKTYVHLGSFKRIIIIQPFGVIVIPQVKKEEEVFILHR